ncbi:MAG: malonyl-ACP O-methyltransferase BioC [Victivallaceae bacterium]|nr:malonyl-ACP O-methyltransferase BioC [Victivallaceae bacterium]
MKPDKQLIKKRFARSLKTYTEHALVQSATAERLLFELSVLTGAKFDRVFEIGCGSGILTRRFARLFKYGKLYLNDLVDECAGLCSKYPDSEFIGGDIESLSPLPRQLDLIISNATFQWFDQLPAVLGRLAETLNPAGILAFSTFGTRNACEITELTGRTLDYLSAPALKHAVSRHFEIGCYHENIRKLHFDHPLDVLRHLQKTGVTAVSRQIWTKSDLQNFVARYIERNKAESGVTLTYHPIILIASLK